MGIDGVFVEIFTVISQLDKYPYNQCLLDVSEGIPEIASLKNFGLDDGHDWKVDPLLFYEELRSAKRFSIKKTFSQLDKISSSQNESKFINTQAKILMWKAEQQTKEDRLLSDKIERLQAKRRAENDKEAESSALKLLGCSDELEPNAYYAKYGPH